MERESGSIRTYGWAFPAVPDGTILPPRSLIGALAWQAGGVSTQRETQRSEEEEEEKKNQSINELIRAAFRVVRWVSEGKKESQPSL